MASKLLSSCLVFEWLRVLSRIYNKTQLDYNVNMVKPVQLNLFMNEDSGNFGKRYSDLLEWSEHMF